MVTKKPYFLLGKVSIKQTKQGETRSLTILHILSFSLGIKDGDYIPDYKHLLSKHQSLPENSSLKIACGGTAAFC